jgi:hypothetical protein
MEKAEETHCRLRGGHSARHRRKRDRGREAGRIKHVAGSREAELDLIHQQGSLEYSPGNRMHDNRGTVGLSKSKGASEYSPGVRMNDRRK